MKKYLFFFYFFLVPTLLTLSGCADKNEVIDQNTEIPDHNWTYVDKLGFDAKIDDEKSAYNLYINLRVTADYKYSNMFVLISQNGPDKNPSVHRFELTLANKDGEWLGKGSGNLYTYQVPFLTQYKFPAKGNYHFYIEQNMRDNPLREVSDVGMRVERVPEP